MAARPAGQLGLVPARRERTGKGARATAKRRSADLNSKLCHGIRQNTSKNKVRLAQYISMMPAQSDNTALRDWRIRAWRERLAPEGYSLHGDPRQWEQKKYHTAQLSPLGEQLLGLRDWQD